MRPNKKLIQVQLKCCDRFVYQIEYNTGTCVDLASSQGKTYTGSNPLFWTTSAQRQFLNVAPFKQQLQNKFYYLALYSSKITYDLRGGLHKQYTSQMVHI